MVQMLTEIFLAVHFILKYIEFYIFHQTPHSFSFFQVALFVCCLSSSKNPKQAAHPNMRTYYFCTDTAKEMESWMKAMTDAALVQAEPVKRFVPVFVILLILMLSPLANSLAPTCDVVFVVYFTSLAPHFLCLC